MLNAIIKLSLKYRVITIALAIVVLCYGGYELYHLPIDVFPDLNRPRVTVMTECPGLAQKKSKPKSRFLWNPRLTGRPASKLSVVRQVLGYR
jgi:Cu/Ag efflux pump CusA